MAWSSKDSIRIQGYVSKFQLLFLQLEGDSFFAESGKQQPQEMEKYGDKFHSLDKFCDFNQFSAKLDSTTPLPEEPQVPLPEEPQVYEEWMKYAMWKCMQAELTKCDVTLIWLTGMKIGWIRWIFPIEKHLCTHYCY